MEMEMPERKNVLPLGTREEFDAKKSVADRIDALIQKANDLAAKNQGHERKELFVRVADNLHESRGELFKNTLGDDAREALLHHLSTIEAWLNDYSGEDGKFTFKDLESGTAN